MIIYVTNQSTRITDADVRAMTAAVDSQLYYHAAPAYGYKPNRCQYTSTPAQVGPPDALIVVTDTPDQVGVLGWHSEKADSSRYGYVFVSPVLDNGGDALHNKTLSVSSVLSHEVLETSLNPGVDVMADAGDGFVWDYEVCDPVEGDAYPIFAEIMVSNFVHPAFFDQSATSNFDHMGTLTKPFSLAPGGYASRMPSGQRADIHRETFSQSRRDSRIYPKI